jgi:pyruvate/2-oxoglutarate dehydrogenase complex dihydrolipoamide dehydrogenase (E3) component
MTSYDYDIGIIGGGAAGLTIASGAAQLGAKTLLLEKEKVLGGDCLHFGCVPSKTLIKSAHVYHLIKTASAYGLPQMVVRPVVFRAVADRVRAVIQTIQKHDSEERFCSLGAKVIFGDAKFIDSHTIRLYGKTYSAKTWAIASGSSAMVPPILGLSQTSYITNRELFSLEHLPESMIVLGGGPIGTEMSQAFCRLGTRVTLVDMADQILSKEDPDMAAVVQHRLTEEGVRLHLGYKIESVRDLGPEREVTIKSPSGQTRRLTAETLLVALGRRANTETLGLTEIGVKFSARGITVDTRLRTTQPHIFAAGDVTGSFQFTHAAGYEGGIVISNAIFRLPRKVNYTYLPWCTYCDPELASIGMNEKAARAAGIDYSVWSEEVKNNDRGLAEGEGTGKIKLILNAKEVPIGVQIVGPHAGDLLNEWIVALNGKVKLSTLATAVHPYPTLGEISKRVAGNVFAQKIFSEKVKKGLKLFFNLKGRACELPESNICDTIGGEDI